MNHTMLTLFALSLLFLPALSGQLQSSHNPSPQMSVRGVVYCDICINNSFSAHSYLIPGADVRIDCQFRAAWPRTSEEIFFSVNRTTNRFGTYNTNVPSVDGLVCEEAAIAASCQATLLQSTCSWCDVPGIRSTTQLTFRSKQPNICIYTLKPLSFRPLNRNATFCG